VIKTAWTSILSTPKKIIRDELTWHQKNKPQKSLKDFEKEENNE